jgi:hypothetical protein
MVGFGLVRRANMKVDCVSLGRAGVTAIRMTGVVAERLEARVSGFQ